MQLDFYEQLKSIKQEEHYLRKININYDCYIKDLRNILQRLNQKISSKKMNGLLKKLQINNKFNELQYIQTACELTVMNEFLNDNFEFIYENKITPPKDVDFTIKKDGVQHNIEVKCPSYVYNKKDKNTIELSFINRAPSLKDKSNIEEAIKEKLKDNFDFIEKKNLDNTLKDFLISTQSKVKDSLLTNINILIVCCDDTIDMHTWRNYLFEYGGFFTDNSFISHSEFDRVDFVCLTNIYNRHYKYYNEHRISDHWKLSSSFNLLYPNKYSKRNQNVIWKNELEKINKIFPNYNIDFEDYLQDDNDIPEREELSMKKQFLGVPFFVDKLEKRGIYHFKTTQSPNKS